MDQIKIGKYIKEKRKSMSLTQRELADKLNISDKTISKWECGNGMPDFNLLNPLCDMLGISVNELLAGEDISSDTYADKAEENIMSLIKENEKQKKNRKYLRVLWKKVNFAEQKNLFDVAKQPNYKLWVKESRN